MVIEVDRSVIHKFVLVRGICGEILFFDKDVLRAIRVTHKIELQTPKMMGSLRLVGKSPKEIKFVPHGTLELRIPGVPQKVKFHQ